MLPAASEARVRPWLERAGFELRALGERPDVAVVDLTGPLGVEELARLRAATETAGLAVLALVGDAHGDAEQGLAAGADGFVALGSVDREFDLRIAAVHRLGRSRLEQASRERDLSLLLDLTAHYASALDVSALLHDVTRRLADELAIERCALVLIDEERGQGRIVAASDDSAVRDVRIELTRYPEIREAMRTGEPVVVDQVESHPLLGEVAQMVVDRGINTLAAVPLTVQGKTLGVLLLRANSGPFRPEEVRFAWTVAHATAIALRNARLLEGLRGQAEKAAEQVAALARYEEFFQYVSDGILILDDQGRMVSLNPAAAQILQVDPEKARGQMFVSFANPISAAAMMEMLTCVRNGMVCRNVDLEVRVRPAGAPAPDPVILTLSVCGSTIRDGGAIILSIRDVTEARAMERELRKTKEFLEKIIDSSGDAVVAADLNGTVLLYNRSAERMLGWRQSEAVGKMNVRNLYSEATVQQLSELPRRPELQERLEPERTEVLARGGERVPVLLSGALICEGDQPVATVCVFSDLRERARLEAKLSRAQERLEEAEKQAMIAELAGTAAHELNQPLTSVMGYAELLKRRLKEGDPAWRPVDIIYREAERMAEIVRKIGKITRYETKTYVGDRKIVDLDRASGEEK